MWYMRPWLPSHSGILQLPVAITEPCLCATVEGGEVGGKGRVIGRFERPCTP